ncbi:amino acid adenylation domain-containing protein [Bacillus cereus]|uniref:Amino acid adenylation domain-containing protein n=1 Tax=Bacillus cereus TaxID=1396 RepID=A0A9W7Q2J6_BACCE|nr:non-ribosomal peptide synthetase [Bacillus cereus]KAA6459460.1 amino acid adenylation domain-containing protein [Bacillus cereus]KAB2502430.1 amino acid adenylation domain-containing protein [Bacillus cereus]
MKINKTSIEDILALTSVQEGMLYHYLKNPEDEKYFEQLTLKLTGPIVNEIVKESWKEIAQKNEVLRSVFRWKKLKNPVQIILKDKELDFHYVDFSIFSADQQEERIESLKKYNRSQNKLDPLNGLFRITLCKISDHQHELIIDNHHILYDGWSTGVLLKEFFEVYEKLKEGLSPKFQNKLSAKDYKKWFQQSNKNPLAFWEEYLKGYEPKFINYRTGYQEEMECGEYLKVKKVMPSLIVQNIKEASSKEGVTVATFFNTAWGILLQHLTNHNDVLFGITISGRDVPLNNIASSVGLFINTVPVRFNYDKMMTKNCLKGMQRDFLNIKPYESTSITEIGEVLQVNQAKDLIESIVVYENYPLDKNIEKESSIKLSGYHMHSSTNYKLTLVIYEDDPFRIELMYDSLHFSHSDSVAISELYYDILIRMTKDVLGDTNVITANKYVSISSGVKKEDIVNPTSNLIPRLFEDCVYTYGDHIALVSEGQGLTYNELNQLINRVAHILHSFSKSKGKLVAIACLRPINNVISMLACLKAGCPYVPIDPTYPEERINYILQDSGAEMILTEKKLCEKLTKEDVEVLFIEEILELNGNDQNLNLDISQEDLGYIIYTSGTTGNPKGVMVNHGSILNTIEWRIKEYELDSNDSVIQLFSFAFDGFLTSFFTPLLSGSRIIMPTIQEVKDPLILKEYIFEQKITHFICVPSFYNSLLDVVDLKSCNSLRMITLAGENLTSHLVEKSEKLLPHVEIINEYGPTEASVAATFKRNVNSKECITIGYPIENVDIFIIGYEGEPQVPGAVGEIVVGGKGVARGYLNKPELTAERFVSHPFRLNEIAYRSGDLGRILSNGEIEYLGRMDQQVKIRGYRIELGEIETQLLTHPLVSEAVVIDRENEAGEKALYAYVVTNGSVSGVELRKHLSAQMPSYMVPSFYITIDRIPLTPNGKVDRKGLPYLTEVFDSGHEYVKPMTELEQSLVEIWEEVLGVRGIGTQDNFFELGGHSLKATSLSAQIHKRLEIEIPLRRLFDYPTIKELANYLQNKNKDIFNGILPVPLQETYEVSSAQKRLFLIQELDTTNTSYNMPGILEITGYLDKERFENTLKRLVERHDSLRTSFEIIEGNLVQRIHPDVKMEILYEEGTVAQKEQIIHSFLQPFNLKEAPLLRVKLVQFGSEEYLLLFDMHHIISDGVSMEIFVKEFGQLYQGKVLPSLNFQYKDYSDWQNSLFESGKLKDQKAYWTSQFSDGCPVLELPTDYPRPKQKAYSGNRISYEFDSKLINQVRNITKKTDTTLYMVLLAAYNVLLHKYTGQDDIVVGSPIAGRSHADLEGIMGMFVNTLPMRNYPTKDKSFKEFLREVKNNTFEALSNQDYPFEEIVEAAGPHTDNSRNPLFDTVFTLQNEFVSQLKIDDLVFEAAKLPYGMSKFDLMFETTVHRNGALSLEVEYSTELFELESVENFLCAYIKILKEACLNPNVKISDIRLISPQDMHILFDLDQSQANYPAVMIHEVFEEQVKRYPKKVAVTDGSEEWTYAELNKRSNQLANRLRQNGVQKGDLVGVMTCRSIEMISSILAVLKVGGAYVPIDPEYPMERKQYMIEDSGLKVLVTESSLFTSIPDTAHSILKLDVHDPTFLLESSDNLNLMLEPSNVAYVIYTSGTTGQPKGVLLEHRNVIRLLINDHSLFDFNESDVWTMFHSYCFDFSVWEMYGALLFGGKLVIIPKEITQSPSEFLELLGKHQVTVLNQTPTAFYALSSINTNSAPLALRYIIFGGEALTPARLRSWKEAYPSTKLINMYGITETTVHVTYKEIGCSEISKNISNIGRPIPTVELYIMKEDEVLPRGGVGEIVVAGDGVARGYLNKPELTAKRFVSHPFRLNEIAYRSGDLGRILSNGEIEYLGRMDQQVKIRGYRIELGEIETQLLTHPLVNEAVVIDRENEAGEKALYAYVVTNGSVSGVELRKHLSAQMPSYMVPSFYITIDRIPLTPNGKVDRKGLPYLTEVFDSGHEYVKPMTELEQSLVEIWEEVLEMNRIGITDNFFDVGGDSIRVLRIISLVKEVHQLDISIKEVYESQTIQVLSKLLEKRELNLNASLLKESRKIETLENNIMEAFIASNEPVLNVDEIYPMSDIELGMVYHYLKNREEAIYHDQIIQTMKVQNFNIESFKKVLSLMAEKHSILRTTFNLKDFAVPVHIIHKEVSIECESFENKDLDNEEFKEFVSHELRNDLKRAFDIEKPLWRIKVFIQKNDLISICLICHHAILDGWSVASLFTEMANCYFTLESNANYVPKKLKSSYKDYIVEQQVLKENEEVKSFWQDELEEFTHFDLPIENKEGGFHSIRGEISKKEINQLKSVCKKLNLSLKSVCFAAYLYTVSRLSYKKDIIVGLVENSRPMCMDADKVLGCFLNTVPVRYQFKHEATWKNYLADVNQKLLKLKDYGRLSLNEILRCINEKSEEGNPLFNTIFNFMDFHVYKEIKNKDLFVENHLSLQSYDRTNTILDFEVSTTFNNFDFKVSSSAFSEKELESLSNHYLRVIREIIKNPESKMDSNKVMSKEEKNKILGFSKGESVFYPKDKLFHDFIVEQVQRNPDKLAVVYKENQLTYKELDMKSDQIASYLLSNGIAPNDLVGIMLDRSTDLIASILGILKSGAAYVPIDPSYPSDRIMHIIVDSQLKFILTKEGLKNKISKFKGIVVDVQKDSLYGDIYSPEVVLTKSNDSAYVIYTSGTTGLPKGVLVNHRGLISLAFAWKHKYLTDESGLTLLQLASVSFDVFVEDLIRTLFWGGTMIVCPEKDRYDFEQLYALVVKHNVSFVESTPALIIPFFDYVYKNNLDVTSLKYVMMGGDKVNLIDFKRIATNFGDRIKVINSYGVTEATIDSTHFCGLGEVDKKITPIGRPLPNVNCYILDEFASLQPIGVPGELFIGGDSVSIGYLNRPDLTKEKFVYNPFEDEYPYMYKTGDLVKWLDDGNIEYLGRIDHQVKIRGYRIELGEIETNLLSHPLVNEAIVIDREDNKEERVLYAYIVTKKPVKSSEFRKYLLNTMPSYMVPSFYINLDKFPLTPNGKIDRKALPLPEVNFDSGQGYTMPVTKVEKALVEIWEEVLGVQGIGTEDNFFDIGGHSLKATTLVARIYKILNLEVPLPKIFEYPTIKRLANYLQFEEEKEFVEISPVELQEVYEVSSAQKRLFLIYEMDPRDISYNMPGALRIKGELNKDIFEKAIYELIRRHESLRTTFEFLEGKPVQKVHRIIPFEISYEEAIEEQKDSLIYAFIQPFDLRKGPLLRVKVIQYGLEDYQLLFDMHHIISDGISMDIFVKEFAQLYSGELLSPLSLQYKDYADWQNNLFKTDDFKKKEIYWNDRFSDGIPTLNLPKDQVHSKQISSNDHRIPFSLGTNLTKRLERLALKMDSTLYMILLASYNVLLHKYTGQKDIVVGSPVAGRSHPDLEGIIGMFVNTLPIRNYPKKEKSFKEFLKEVKVNVLNAFENQEYPTEKIVENLSEKHFQSTENLFKTMFVFENMKSRDINEILIKDNFELSVKVDQIKSVSSKADLTIMLEQGAFELSGIIECASNLYSEETAKTLSESFISLLEQIESNIEILISDIEFNSYKKEDEMLIEDFEFNF